MSIPRLSTAVTCLLLLGTSLGPIARARQNTQPVAPDNTKTNQRDRSQDEPTADQQKTNSSDQTITQKIRQSIVQDKSLSTYAHNIKVITQDGKVTLKGPVRSEEEKRSIEEKATSIAGAGHVTNEIEIASK
jgi:osmotically-inducible protein OsmY